MGSVHRGLLIMNIFIPRSGRIQVYAMKSAVIKRSVLIEGRKTSISLEDEFWDGLREIAEHGRLGLSRLVEQINQDRNNINLSSAIRVFVFRHFWTLSKKAPGLEATDLTAEAQDGRHVDGP